MLFQEMMQMLVNIQPEILIVDLHFYYSGILKIGCRLSTTNFKMLIKKSDYFF